MTVLIIIVVIIVLLFLFSKFTNRPQHDSNNEILFEITNDFKLIIAKYKAECLPKIIAKAQLNPNPNKEQVMREMGNNGEINGIVTPIIEGVLKPDIDRLTYEIFSFGVACSNLTSEDIKTEKFDLHSFTIRSTIHFVLKNDFIKMNILKYNEKQLSEFITVRAKFATEQLNKAYDKYD